MDSLLFLERCDDGSCCCLSPRTSVVFVSIISLLASLVDAVEGGGCAAEPLAALRRTLVTLFRTANLLALLGSAVENAMLLQIYLWYALGFVVLSLMLSIADFLFRFQDEGAWSLTSFAIEVAFLFVTFRCLPLVDLYRKRLGGT